MSKSMTRTLAPAWRPSRRLARWAALWQDLIGAWRLAIARRPEAQLDDAALRDLGLRRCELDSYLAELDGRVEATRVRAIRQRDAMMQ